MCNLAFSIAILYQFTRRTRFEAITALFTLTAISTCDDSSGHYVVIYSCLRTMGDVFGGRWIIGCVETLCVYKVETRGFQ